MFTFKGLTLVLLLAAALGACANPLMPGRGRYNPEQDFKPYVASEIHAIPMAYPAESWAYPAGTSTREIAKRWRMAALVMGVRNRNGIVEADIGSQFYNLSNSSRQGLAQAVAQLYNAPAYRVVDYNTKKVVGAYSAQGLQLY